MREMLNFTDEELDELWDALQARLKIRIQEAQQTIRDLSNEKYDIEDQIRKAKSVLQSEVSRLETTKNERWLLSCVPDQ